LRSQNLPITLQLLKCRFLPTSEDYSTSTILCQIPFLILQRKTPGLSRTGGRTENYDDASLVVSVAPLPSIVGSFHPVGERDQAFLSTHIIPRFLCFCQVSFESVATRSRRSLAHKRSIDFYAILIQIVEDCCLAEDLRDLASTAEGRDPLVRSSTSRKWRHVLLATSLLDELKTSRPQDIRPRHKIQHGKRHGPGGQHHRLEANA